MSTLKKVAIIGSGNWGSAIARIVGTNVSRFDFFEQVVKMFVYEETIDGRKLSEIINSDHENVKYLPCYKIPNNVIAVTDVLETAQDADILIFVLPHKFIGPICKPLIGNVKSSAVGISLIKGFDIPAEGGIELISNLIKNMLNIEMCVLMGANLASEVADQQFCETTIGCKDAETGRLLKDLVQTDYFRVKVVEDVSTVEICGALKNIVACAAGFVDGLDYGENTKAAVIRLGLMEMVAFAETFYPGAKLATFFESSGIGDLITTCYGGRNRRVSEAFVRTGKSIEELEKEMLNGQRTQGPQTAEEVHLLIHKHAMEERFPLFTSVYKICQREMEPGQLVGAIRCHPAHL